MSYKSLLKITELPQDRLQALGKLRTVLVGAFNKSRASTRNMTLLKATVKALHAKIVEFEKEQEKLAKELVAAAPVDTNTDTQQKESK